MIELLEGVDIGSVKEGLILMESLLVERMVRETNIVRLDPFPSKEIEVKFHVVAGRRILLERPQTLFQLVHGALLSLI